jgi:hypothetical protein
LILYRQEEVDLNKASEYVLSYSLIKPEIIAELRKVVVSSSSARTNDMQKQVELTVKTSTHEEKLPQRAPYLVNTECSNVTKVLASRISMLREVLDNRRRQGLVIHLRPIQSRLAFTLAS